MSSSTWTPAALSSEAQALAGRCWRVVEAQHRVSTLKIVDTLDEQELLEALIEEAKPPVPPECRHLHYLLATPFRYGSAYPRGSRFRRAGFTEGVFYAAEKAETAVAEVAFYRLLFFAESPGTPWPSNPSEHAAFAVDYATGRAIDLTAAPFAASAATWTDPTDYGPCQALADAARAASVDVIRYASARDPGKGVNFAILACRAFAAPEPVALQSWRLHFRDAGVQAICEAPRKRLSFARDDFASDPRIT